MPLDPARPALGLLLHSCLVLAAAWSLAAPARAALPRADSWPQRRPLLGEPGALMDPALQLVATGMGMATVPIRRLANDVGVAATGGAGLGVGFRFLPEHAFRLTALWSRTRFTSKVAGLQGGVTLHQVALRADYVFGHSWWRPYLGGIIGVGPWKGRVTEKATQLSNDDDGGSPLLGGAAVGLDLNLIGNLSVAPEASWTLVGGGFVGALWQAGLALRWEN